MEDLRRGIAAQLRLALPANEGQVSPYPLGSPKPPTVMVSHIERMEALDFGDGRKYWLIVEAVVPATFDKVNHQRLDGLVVSVADAVEADQRLTSRLLDNGTVQAGQAPACDSIAFEEYRGAVRATLEDGTSVLSATWLVVVIT